jgi:hypothetical protein
MMKRQFALLPLSAVALIAAGSASAESFALGAKAGTTGVGIEGTFAVSERFNLRGGVYAVGVGWDDTRLGIPYDGDADLKNAGLFLDWHPAAGVFRVSIAGFQTDNTLNGDAEGELDVGGTIYSSVLNANIEWDGFAPYLGIGWGNAVRNPGWSFSFDLGVIFVGEPSVSLTGTVSDPSLEEAFQEDLAREEQALQEDFEDAKYHPVVSLGFAYRF